MALPQLQVSSLRPYFSFFTFTTHPVGNCNGLDPFGNGLNPFPFLLLLGTKYRLHHPGKDPIPTHRYAPTTMHNTMCCDGRKDGGNEIDFLLSSIVRPLPSVVVVLFNLMAIPQHRRREYVDMARDSTRVNINPNQPIDR